MGVLVLLTFCGGSGDAVQNRESPDFRSQEVGRYALERYQGRPVSLQTFQPLRIKQGESEIDAIRNRISGFDK